MILLDVQGVLKQYGSEPVLDAVTFEVRPGERIALVGPNGSGKTTLLRILSGKEEPDRGRCARHPAVSLGLLEQQPRFEPGRSLREEARSALAGLLALQQQAVAVAAAIGECSDAAQRERLEARYDHVQQELHRQDAYQLDHKIERVLDGLGFAASGRNQPAESLSGGEQNRLMLAKLLLAEPNLMLLDEPSNHLDIAATEWLEDFLLESSAAMILVSHDRYFLDKVATRTLELLHGSVDSYTGNFSAYWQQKAQRLLVEQRTYQKQQAEMAKAKEFIRRNAYGQRHAQAEDRRKKLARLPRVPPPREISGPPMGFGEVLRSGDLVLRAEQLAKAFQRPLFRQLSFEITRGQRWALLGPNGCGKTTLLRCLLGLEPPDAGSVRLGTGVEVAYFDQQLTTLGDELPAVEAVRPPQRQLETQPRRDLLARFGITGDRALQPVQSLSGGERCRAALARLAATGANFLVLDEPTNHLDLWAREALERALLRFEGTVLFVSHDRYFVNQVADHLLVMEVEGVRVVEGNYEAYQQLLSRGKTTAAAGGGGLDLGTSSATGQQPAAPKDQQPARAKRRFPFRKLSDLEEEIFQREADLRELHRQLGREETHRKAVLVRHLVAEIAHQQAALKTLYEHWEEAAERDW